MHVETQAHTVRDARRSHRRLSLPASMPSDILPTTSVRDLITSPRPDILQSREFLAEDAVKALTLNDEYRKLPLGEQEKVRSYVDKAVIMRLIVSEARDPAVKIQEDVLNAHRIDVLEQSKQKAKSAIASRARIFRRRSRPENEAELAAIAKVKEALTEIKTRSYSVPELRQLDKKFIETVHANAYHSIYKLKKADQAPIDPARSEHFRSATELFSGPQAAPLRNPRRPQLDFAEFADAIPESERLHANPDAWD